MESEIWKDVKGYEGYYKVSNAGSVKSLIRDSPNHRNTVERILAKTLSSRIPGLGYYMVTLCIDGKMNAWRVARLVAIAFKENPYNKPSVNHLDGNKLNNRVSNLEWATYSENNQHAYDTKLIKRPNGWNSPNKTHSEQEVISVKRLMSEGLRDCDILRIHTNFARNKLSDIRNGKYWKNVGEHYNEAIEKNNKESPSKFTGRPKSLYI